MQSRYLDFVDDNNENVRVYTKLTKKRLYVGYIKKAPFTGFGFSKFMPEEGIVFGTHCLLALSRECAELDKKYGMKD
jgi:hypothetical protein